MVFLILPFCNLSPRFVFSVYGVSFSGNNADLPDPLLQSRISAILADILDHVPHGLTASQNGDTVPGTGNSGVQKVAVEQHSGAAQQWQDHRRIFASLGLMDRNGIREFQFLQCRERIVDPSSVIEFRRQCGHGIIDFLDPSHISVEYTHSLVDGKRSCVTLLLCTICIPVRSMANCSLRMSSPLSGYTPSGESPTVSCPLGPHLCTSSSSIFCSAFCQIQSYYLLLPLLLRRDDGSPDKTNINSNISSFIPSIACIVCKDNFLERKTAIEAQKKRCSKSIKSLETSPLLNIAGSCLLNQVFSCHIGRLRHTQNVKDRKGATSAKTPFSTLAFLFSVT